MKAKLYEQNVINDMIRWRKNGITYRGIAGLLKQEHDIDVAVMTVRRKLIELMGVQDEDNTDTEQELTTNAVEPITSADKEESGTPSPQDILYEHRAEVIRMKKDHYANFVIARQFGVNTEDVFEFFTKRKKIEPENYRDILYQYTQGKNCKEIADQYGVHEKTIEQIIERNRGVLTTSTKVISKIRSEYEQQESDTTEEEQANSFDINTVKNFTNLISTIERHYNIQLKSIETLDNVRNDVYHKLELMDTTEEEQLQMLERIRQTSIDRRQAKDFVEIVQPLIDFLQDADNKRMVATLANIAGRIVNTAKRMESRVYFLRDTEEN